MVQSFGVTGRNTFFFYIGRAVKMYEPCAMLIGKKQPLQYCFVKRGEGEPLSADLGVRGLRQALCMH